jgi:hypothetical protein
VVVASRCAEAHANSREEAVRRTVSTTALLVAAALAVPQPAFAQEGKAPPLVEQVNGGNRLDPQEAEELRDELFYQRAVHAYMTMLPALNVIGMRDGSEAAFGAGYNVLPIWKYVPTEPPLDGSYEFPDVRRTAG